MRNQVRVFLIAWMCATAGIGIVGQASPSSDLSAGARIDEVHVTCRIDGRQLAVTVEFEARTTQASHGMVLIQGDTVLAGANHDSLVLVGGRLDYDPNSKAYRILWPQPGRHRVAATFVAQSVIEPNSAWRQASLQVPGGRVRRIRLVSSQPDLEVQLPQSLQVQRRVEGGQLIVEALLGPREPLEIRWKPQVQLADAKLVLSSQANTVVDVRAALCQVDALFDFQIAQGKLETLTFQVPAGLSITAVHGASIRTWALGDTVPSGEGVPPLRPAGILPAPEERGQDALVTRGRDARDTQGQDALATKTLRVELSRAQDREYRLRIHAEAAIDSLPATVEVPVIEPTGDIRAGGHLAVGTNSALQLVVQASSGLTQVDAAVFPRIQTQDGQIRGIPQGKAFFYTYAGSRYRLGLLVDDIVPAYEVAGRMIARVKEDDLVIDAELELEVRDAPVRQLEVVVPASLAVAAVDGNQVGDYHLPDAPSAGRQTSVRVVFKEPVIGRTLLRLRLELGRGPLGERQNIPALRVTGAKTQRGYVVVVADQGIEIDPPQVQALHEVHTASVPLRVPGAQYAYRFREADWTLALMARRRPAEVRAEVFHVESIGETLAYGSAAINYVITGSPVDELRFRLPESLENVEFVGRDVRRWVRQDGIWVVKLNRKVLGDYSLAVTYTQQHGPDRPIQLGALHCQDIQTQTGYVVVTSHFDLRLQLARGEGVPPLRPAGILPAEEQRGQDALATRGRDARDTQGQDALATLLPIALDELPGDYRLLTSSPILAAYKYIAEPHVAMLEIETYRRSELLPVVVDIADLQTTLAVRPDGRIESVTTVRYKVKNTTGQFLALTMPADARVWAVSQIEGPASVPRGMGFQPMNHRQDADATGQRVQASGPAPGAAERPIRLAVSHDQNTGQLLIPLRRQANPNDPATIVLEYGQVHESGTWWKRKVDLAAPRCIVPIAYADWQVVVPHRWAIAGIGGNMQLSRAATPSKHTGLAGLADRLIRLWQRAIERVLVDEAFWVFLGLMAMLTVVSAILKRRFVPDLIVLAVLAAAVWVGVKAEMADPAPAQGQEFASLRYAQAAIVDPGQALHVSAGLVPAWREALGLADVVAVAAIVAAGAGAALVSRRLRTIALAAAAAALIYLAAEIPATWPVLKALMTWLIPAGAAAWFVYRAWRRQQEISRASRTGPEGGTPSTQVAVMLILPAVCLSSGCSAVGSGAASAGGRPLVERIECSLSAGTDSMEIEYSLRIRADRPASFPLVDESAVLVSSVTPDSHVVLRTEQGRHVVQVAKPGVYDVNATFLASLPAPGQDQQRRFELALPTALTNRIRLVIPDANVSVEAPQAVFLSTEQQEGQTQVETMFAPGRPAVFAWRPLERQAAQEQVRFYARDLALAHVTPGLLQVFYEVRLQIAQGQVDRLTFDVAPGQTVTSVDGPRVGAWRFDPVEHRLEVRLLQPVTGSYGMTLVAQSASAAVPYEVHLEPLIVHEALDQHSMVGIAAEPSVYVRLDRHPAAMNVADYVREAGGLIKAVSGLAVAQINQAFRYEGDADSTGGAVVGHVQAVQSEVRSQETARFNVEDDRLVYNSQWEIEIAKAGRFDIDLLLPEGFDIDTLEAQEVSHWDESPSMQPGSAGSGEADQRHVRVHFKHRLTGLVRLKLALSQAVSEIPERLTAPRVTVAGGIKHTGYLVVGSEQGVRVSVASRQGVSEVNPVELGHAAQGFLAFQFLRPDWQIQLQTELIQARVTVQGLHVAKVTDGLVRHEHALQYRLYHAGTKAFALTLPAEAVGVTIAGPGIARREQSGPGQWRVELADKVYDRPYLMSVNYETRYDPADGNVPLVPVRCDDADLQQGYVAVFATDRVELAAESADVALRPADARGIPGYFGAGDLSGAAMCYRSISPQYSLTVRARRHAAAGQIDAEVLKTDLVSVVTATGQTINRAVLTLRVGGRRHLRTTLPEGASIWSLAVDGRAVQPSLGATAGGGSTLLVPLPQQATDEVLMDIVYIGSLPLPGRAGGVSHWSGRHSLAGPRFDLPLKNISWQVYMPAGFTYSDFGGTLSIDQRIAGAGSVLRYDLQTYQQQVLESNRYNDQVAQQQQTLARELAQKGDQTAARQALTKGYNFSVGNTALNEDIRVDLDNLLRQQAKVGLITARDRLRQQSGAAPDSQVAGVLPPGGQGFSQQQAERMENSLGQADSENLELITRRIIQTQAAAETSVSQIQVTMPACGQVLRFDSPLQVEPSAEMAVAFTARPQRLARVNPSVWYGCGLFAILLACIAAARSICGPWARLHAI